MHDYKMIVLDIDDTLIKSDRTISKNTRDCLINIQEKGIKVVLASGRPTFAMKKLADELKIADNNGYVISFNGARIAELKSKKELYASNLSKDQIHMLYDMSKEAGAFIQTYIGDYIVASEENEYTDIEKKITGMKCKRYNKTSSFRQ